ncbi:MAG: pyrimidine utilization protein A [Actinomycetota bacterium]|nr:pyrimidine utilization protein A [Actinomycetota bacterium]
MDFGVFIPINNNGWIISEASPQYMPSFDLNRQIVQLAEQYGFEFALSMVKLRGFGGPTEFWDHGLESFTLMSGLAAVTEKIKLYASVATLTLPPAMVARMAVTIDDISDGRFGINIVSGWNQSEYSQMGLWPGEDFYGQRYDYASEYVAIMKELWATGHSSFKGDFFTYEDCLVQPTPAHDIDIVCAGQSQRGMEFCATYGDYNFIIGDRAGTELAAANAQLAGEAAKTGRDVGSYALYTIVMGETDEEAEAKVESYRAGADLEALAFMSGQAGLDTAGATAAKITELQGACFFNIGIIAGSHATVAAEIDRLAAIEGTKGMMLVFDDFVAGIAEFGEKVMPLLTCREAPMVGA